MNTTTYTPLNADIAVSPRMHKALLHACRILDMRLEDYLACHLESELEALRYENQKRVQSKLLDAYIRQHATDSLPVENKGYQYTKLELEEIMLNKICKAAKQYGITPLQWVTLILDFQIKDKYSPEREGEYID